MNFSFSLKNKIAVITLEGIPYCVVNNYLKIKNSKFKYMDNSNNENNYYQNDEETGENYAMLPSNSSSTNVNSSIRNNNGYSPLNSTLTKKKMSKRKIFLFIMLVLSFFISLSLFYLVKCNEVYQSYLVS